MTEYKIVASDLDGTLLNNCSRISPENTAAISELAKRGVYFVPCSGRTFSEMPRDLVESPDVRYIIHSNGAVVLDKQTGKRITTCISSQKSRELLDIFFEYDAHLTIRQGGNSIVDAHRNTDEDYKYYNFIEAHSVVIRNFANPVEDFERVSYTFDEIEVISAFFHNYEDKQECVKRLAQVDGIRSVEVSEYNLEVFNIDAGKGNALHMLADELGVDYSQTMSLGDSDNDVTVTEAAGLGLAVSNACDALKEIADGIICSNEEHAVAYVLEKYF